MPAEIPAAFDCSATAALLRSGGSISLAGHIAAVISVVTIGKAGSGVWIERGSLLVWCAIVYLTVRVKLDASFFELLTIHPAEQLDQWLDATGLRKSAPPRSTEQRRRGAMRLWRALVAAVAIEIALMMLGTLRLLS
jgi:hypothetical protein